MVRIILIVGTLLLLAVSCSSPQETAPQTESTQLATATEAPATPPSTGSVTERDSALLEQGREYTERFYRGEIDLLYDEFSPGLKQELSLEQFSTAYEYVGANLGKQIQIVREDAATSDEYRAFIRWANFDKTDEIIEIRWTMRRDDNSIAEFWIRPAEKKPGSAGSF